MYTSQNFRAFSRVGDHVEFVGYLTVEPEFRAVAKKGSQAHRSVGGDAALSGNNALDTALRHASIQRQARLAQAHGLQKFFIEDFTRMNGRHAVVHHDLLVIINDFNEICIPFAPDETNTPLAVDADAVLPSPITLQSFQAVPWGNAQVVQGNGAVQNFELAHSGALDVWRQASNANALKQILRPAVFEARNHGKNVTRKACNDKRITSGSRGYPV